MSAFTQTIVPHPSDGGSHIRWGAFHAGLLGPRPPDPCSGAPTNDRCRHSHLPICSPTHQSIPPPTLPSVIHPSVCPSIIPLYTHPPAIPSLIHPLTPSPTHLPSTGPSIHPSIHLSTYPSTHLPTHPCIHPSIHPHTHPSNHLLATLLL